MSADKDWPSGAVIYGADDLLKRLEIRITRSGSQKSAARTLGVSPQFINDVLRGRREITETLAQRLGYERHVVYFNRREARSLWSRGL